MLKGQKAAQNGGAQKATVQRALGAMSGTSLDGVDAAVVETDGVEIHGFGASEYRAYSAEEQAVLTEALGHWAGPEAEAAAKGDRGGACRGVGAV